MDAYNKAKEADPEFYRDASSLQYGKVLSVLSYHINKYFIVLFKVHVEIKSLFKSIGVLPCSGVKCPRRKYQQNGQGAQGAWREAEILQQEAQVQWRQGHWLDQRPEWALQQEDRAGLWQVHAWDQEQLGKRDCLTWLINLAQRYLLALELTTRLAASGPVVFFGVVTFSTCNLWATISLGIVRYPNWVVMPRGWCHVQTVVCSASWMSNSDGSFYGYKCWA